MFPGFSGLQNPNLIQKFCNLRWLTRYSQRQSGAIFHNNISNSSFLLNPKNQHEKNCSEDNNALQKHSLYKITFEDLENVYYCFKAKSIVKI